MSGNSAESAKNLAKSATPLGFFAAMKEIDLMKDMPFVAAFMVALLKDILDFVFFSTVVIPMLFSMLCSIFIFMMMVLASFGEKGGLGKSLNKKIISLLGGAVTEFLPGLSFAPAASISVLAIYVMTLSDRANSKK